MRLKTLIVVLTALLVAASASAATKTGTTTKPRKHAKQYDCSARISKAVERYQHGRYNETKTLLQEVQLNCGGHSAIDSAIYYLAMSEMRGDQAVEAKADFRKLADNYPSSVFSEEARFRMGQCSFLQSPSFDRDQAETNDAIRELTDFVEAYAQSSWVDSAQMYLTKCNDKLARKEFTNARFYHRIDKYDAAVVYYRGLIQEFPASRYVPESRLYLAQALAQLDRVTEARAAVDELLNGTYADDIKRRARLVEARLQGKKE
jgi:outer membrane protein assembly factor BamD